MHPRYRSLLVFTLLCALPCLGGCGLFKHSYGLELGVSDLQQVRSLFVIVGHESALQATPETAMALVSPDKQAGYLYFAQILPAQGGGWEEEQQWELAGTERDLVSVDTARDGSVSVSVGHKLLDAYPDAALVLIADCAHVDKPGIMSISKDALHGGSDGKFRVHGASGVIQLAN